jgi:hypothetical protein
MLPKSIHGNKKGKYLAGKNMNGVIKRDMHIKSKLCSCPYFTVQL